jgi:tetratricopeptide (TPR) repeat protein
VGNAVRSDVTRLLKRGLNHYGLGDLEAAIASWEHALALDPDNRAAQDYLESAREEAGKPAVPRPATTARRARPSAAVEADDSTPRTLDSLLHATAGGGEDDDVARALQMYKNGKLDEAYDLLKQVAAEQPDRLDVEGYLTMIRGKRARVWARIVGDQGRSLRVVMPLAQLKTLSLRPDEGYMLSQVDGTTPIEHILSISTDRVRALEILARLIRERVIE